MTAVEELERMWKQGVISYLPSPSEDLLEGTGKSLKNPPCNYLPCKNFKSELAAYESGMWLFIPIIGVYNHNPFHD
jgi:hypothetical protein